MTDAPNPPAHIAGFVQILGVDDTVAFLLAFGGAELYFGRTAKSQGNLARIVGSAKAAALVAASDQFQRRIPTAKPWIAKVQKSKGLSVAQIARKLHCSDVAVRGWLGRPEEKPLSDPMQPELPF